MCLGKSFQSLDENKATLGSLPETLTPRQKLGTETGAPPLTLKALNNQPQRIRVSLGISFWEIEKTQAWCQMENSTQI